MDAKTDRRRSIRQRTLKGASISNPGSQNVECVVRNMSKFGAGLVLENTIGIPDSFRLTIKPECVTRDCRVTWRSVYTMGVAFNKPL